MSLLVCIVGPLDGIAHVYMPPANGCGSPPVSAFEQNSKSRIPASDAEMQSDHCSIPQLKAAKGRADLVMFRLANPPCSDWRLYGRSTRMYLAAMNQNQMRQSDISTLKFALDASYGTPARSGHNPFFTFSSFTCDWPPARPT